jgi:plastin-1
VPPISPEAININPATIHHKNENLNLAIESARSIGCVVINLNPQFIREKREHIILGLIWQIIRVKYFSKIQIHIGNQLNLKQYPELILLKRPDEDNDIMQKLGY